MKFSLGFLSALLSLPIIVSSAVDLPARACSYGQAIAPTTETRTYENPQLGITFQIPANYRAMGMQSGSVHIMNPTNFDYIQCLTQRGRGEGGWFSSIVITPTPVAVGDRTLEQLIRTENPWLTESIQLATQNNKTVAVWTSFDAHDEITIMNIAFLSRDQRRLITISGPQNDTVFQQAMLSIQLR